MSKKSLLHDRTFLSKQVPKSTKYSHVGPSIDTGSSTLNHLRKLKDNHVPHKYLDNELFVRLKPVLLGRLIYETQMEVDVSAVEDAIVSRMTSPTPFPGAGGGRPIYSRNNPHPMHSADSVGALMADHPTPTPAASVYAPFSSTPIPSHRQQYEPLISGSINGSRSVLTSSHASMLSAPGQHGQRLNGSADSGYGSRVPYLLLDVREASAWAKCHIVGALPYPAVFIKRDQMSRDLVMYRNREDKVIVLYDDDESIAVPAAQTLAERGFSNVYVLSGGINHLVERLSGILIGDPPTPPKLKRATTSTTSLPKIRTAASSASASSTSTSSPASRRSSSLAALAPPQSDDSIPPQSGCFNMHDLERSLQYHALRSATPASIAGSQLTSRASSRMSVASTMYAGPMAASGPRRTSGSGGGMVSADVRRGPTPAGRVGVGSGSGARGPSKLGRS
ncbi:hypothetical protein BCR44DRAFT_1429295 [Catenaria anguillulae PL171]|uniref:Rhodanese domain-containing protein n=1 Tax=Catenaria anguillulae PL171 TaxID=765915 RepID=A0A1Y2HTL6_9FUNG|nr:hypothetical protein BCR44DRAFT_1429295 [Catenaria anguillulae PL171]